MNIKEITPFHMEVASELINNSDFLKLMLKKLTSSDKNNDEKPINNMTLEEAHNFFSQKLSESATNTQKNYLCDVKSVLSSVVNKYFKSKKWHKIRISDIQAEQIKKSVELLFSDKKYQVTTLKRRKYGWNSFCKFIGKLEWIISHKIRENISFDVESICSEKSIEMINFCEEMASSEKTISKKIRWLRRSVAINIGLNEGLRSCEYKNVQFDDVLEKGVIVVRSSKHDGWRTIPVTGFTKNAVSRLKKLLEFHHEINEDCGVFDHTCGKPISIRSFQRWIKDVGELVKVSKNLSKTHGLRHRFARNYFEKHNNLGTCLD